MAVDPLRDSSTVDVQRWLIAAVTAALLDFAAVTPRQERISATLVPGIDESLVNIDE